MLGGWGSEENIEEKCHGLGFLLSALEGDGVVQVHKDSVKYMYGECCGRAANAKLTISRQCTSG